MVTIPGGGGPYSGGLHAISPGDQAPRQLTTNPWDNNPSFAPSGNRLVFRRTNASDSGIHMHDLRSGTTTRLLTRDDDLDPAFGRRGMIAFLRFSRQTLSYDLLLRLPSSQLRRLTSTTATEGEPVFTPDGRRIIFNRYYRRAVPLAESEEAPPPALFSIRIDGSGLKRIRSADTNDLSFDISPNGRRLVFFRVRGGGTIEEVRTEAWTQALAGGKPTLLSSNAAYPSYSPGGRRFVYSNHQGLWLHSADGSGVPTLLFGANFSPSEGRGILVTSPVWQPLPSPSGR